MKTRSNSEIVKQKIAFLAHPMIDSEPTSVKQALAHKEWKKAMDQKFEALLRNVTWVLVPQTSYMNIMGNFKLRLMIKCTSIKED